MHRDLKADLVRRGISQQDLAKELRITPSNLSYILNDRRAPPADFERRVTAALDKLEKAERAADRARQKVLREAGGGRREARRPGRRRCPVPA